MQKGERDQPEKFTPKKLDNFSVARGRTYYEHPFEMYMLFLIFILKLVIN